jgi:hypothetical protein
MESLPLRVSGVTKAFNKGNGLPWRRSSKPAKAVKAVDSVSFAVNRGEVFGVIGATAPANRRSCALSARCSCQTPAKSRSSA